MWRENDSGSLDKTNINQGVVENYKNRTDVWRVDFVEPIKMEKEDE